MADAAGFDGVAALDEHRALHRALSAELPVIAFPGHPRTPDAVFPNNVFATAPRAPDRRPHAPRGQAARGGTRRYPRLLPRHPRLSGNRPVHPAASLNLTGALVIDRARGLGFCGLSERCDEAGAALMHRAFGLRATLMFDLAPGEYHTNVVLALLAGRAVLFAAPGFADSRVPAALGELYGPLAIALSPDEQAAFAANAIALRPDSVWMSERAARALSADTRRRLEAQAGFVVRDVPLAAVEAGGGSLRCCVGEIF